MNQLKDNNITYPPALEIKRLKKIYKNGTEAVKGVDLIVEKGDFFALLGANGAGKSTIIGMITTLLRKTAGTIAINGFDLDIEPQKAKASLGLVPQEVNLNIFETCEEILLNQGGYYGLSREKARISAIELLHKLGLWEKKHTTIRHLSGGMKRRLMIARAMIHQPGLLILDEPTAGVDIEIRRNVWEFLSALNQAGTTIILTTHYLEEAEHLCKNIAIIAKGRIIENTSKQALLKNLHHQTFVFNTETPIEHLSALPFDAIRLDTHSFEIRIDKHYSLNDVFVVFNQHNIKIESMRNKTNRLEELFLDLINVSSTQKS